MANQTFTVTVPDIHQGTAMFWPRVLAPADGARMLVDTNGNPQNPAASTWAAATGYSLGQEVWDGTNIEIAIVAGTSGSTTPIWPAVGATVVDSSVTWLNLGPPYSMGALDGPSTFELLTKEEEVSIDQEPAPVDAVMTAQSAMIEITAKESSLAKITLALAGSLYSSGTDTGLPAGAQAYQQIDFGGLGLPGLYAPGVGACCALISPRRGFSSPGKFMVAVLYNAYPKQPFQIGFTRTKEALYKVQFAGMANLWRTQGKRVAQFYRQT
jgi:hypothetical protein